MGRADLADAWPPLRTLTDLALRRWNVRLRCPRCGHERVMSGAGLWWLFQRRHWSDALEDVKRRLYCAACMAGNCGKVAPRIDKTRGIPTGAPLPDPPAHEWKRQIARYRS